MLPLKVKQLHRSKECITGWIQLAPDGCESLTRNSVDLATPHPIPPKREIPPATRASRHVEL